MKSIINKPWGSYTVIENGKDYVVKKLIIKTNEKTSLQSHDYRSEHWIIVQGIAEVTINKETKTIRANENIFIPIKAKHRIANQHNEDLVIIEKPADPEKLETALSLLGKAYSLKNSSFLGTIYASKE